MNRHNTATPLDAQLKRFQRRLIVVAFVRTLPAALTLGVLAALGIAWIGSWRSNAVTAAFTLGLAGAAVASALLARRLAGSIAHTAATLDRRFGLANRIATAWQFRAQTDRMSGLIMADANLALSSRRPQDLSFEPPRHLGWMLCGLAVALAAFALSGSFTNARRDRGSSQSVLKDIGSAPFSSNDTRAPSSTSMVSSESAARAGATAPGARREAATSSPSALTIPEGSGRSAVASAASTEPAARNPDESERVPATQAPNSAGGGLGANAGRASDRKAASTVGAGSPNALQTAPAELGGASGSVSARGSTASAGGVRGGSTAGEHSDDARHITGARATSTALATWNRAESALAHEPLPLELRSYVRDYLIAVRPGRQP
jgi:hypothetical protein